MATDLRTGIIETANALGISPLDLATIISYETAGTFDPTKAGPTTKWGQHRGLIQFGEPQAKQYGVNWDDPLGSQLGPDGAVAAYLRDTGVKPGMGLLDVYSAVNAGGVGPKYYGRSDTAAGGAPGTVRDKVEGQMDGHRRKAEALLGGSYSPAPGSMSPNAPATASLPTEVAPSSTFGAMTPPSEEEGGSDIMKMLLAMQAQEQPVEAPQAQFGNPYGAALSQYIQQIRRT